MTTDTTPDTIVEVARAVLAHNRAAGAVPTEGEPLWWWTRLENAVADGSEQEVAAVLTHIKWRTRRHMDMAGSVFGQETLVIFERIEAVLKQHYGL